MGKVYLVGAGPGDPELLAVRAARLLREADIVLHDALVSSEILQQIGSARVIDIGKRCGTKLLTQEEINSLLVNYAAQYETVVRLKSGDPSVFGRAGEEIEALVRAGIAYELVPGITSVIAGAAAAGISLTDRRFSASIVIATAHRGCGAEATAWDKLVSSHSTLAIYMPGKDYNLVASQLRNAGLDPRTPCAIVSHAGRSTQQVRCCDLTSLGAIEALPAPSLLIVGECSRPLHESQQALQCGLSAGQTESWGEAEPSNL
jgi:uroporphyrin-III C-methyltransferase